MTAPFDLLTLPFDQYQRYRAVAEVAGAVRAYLSNPRLRVLDVGGFHRTIGGHAVLPVAHALPSDRAFVTDLVQGVPPNYVRATGTALPFASTAFELVVTCDTLEHVPSSDRSAFVDELLRVASHCVLLVAPFDSEHTSRAERILREYLAASGREHRPLTEHFEHGLPSAQDLRARLSAIGLSSIEFADGYLPNWLAMITICLTFGFSSAFLANLSRFYNRHFSPDDRREPAYRRVFVIAKQGHENLLPAISSTVSASPAASLPRPDFAEDLASLLEQARHEYSRLGSPDAENAGLLRKLKNSGQDLFIRFMQWLYAWRKRLAGGADG